MKLLFAGEINADSIAITNDPSGFDVIGSPQTVAAAHNVSTALAVLPTLVDRIYLVVVHIVNGAAASTVVFYARTSSNGQSTTFGHVTAGGALSANLFDHTIVATQTTGALATIGFSITRVSG